ncbi:Predicted Fe-S oxidoreductase (plasmid) [Legionella adelaidensis]|uniref:Predicted Fe-S oxidoreductase n=1 Tax=Legionella adelaidensis TaxID=45056 RepID=A0A0W0R1H8_9GAMM|nr:PA0069 family radical SAM protein [Legionella adelaidensis]KTC64877.1 Radical SAM superfamily protein [Legionella adelaidensis]VEH82952.1 Predicted Fe-S oxidoreductase [Legionella adelaidensis]
MKQKPNTKNRGAISNPHGRFEINTYEKYDDGWGEEEEEMPPLETFLYPEPAKTIITRNNSPDIGFEQSINPYRGCEHGCIYCYARPSHAYVNLSPGLDFETKIFYKEDAAELLKREINKAKYICKPIVIGANTDPYQPVEGELKITRSLLEILWEHKHPVIIITKNSLVERDIDILSKMAKHNLVRVNVSITTLSIELKRIMEPRTSAPMARVRVAKNLIEQNIPVNVMVAPVIPMVNDMELEKILRTISEAGIKHAAYVLIRLPYEVKDLFKEWLGQHFPQKAEHVMSLIKQMRGGKEYDSAFGKRMRGEGQFASLLETRFRLACKRFNINTTPSIDLDCSQLIKKNQSMNGQLDLFAGIV